MKTAALWVLVLTAQSAIADEPAPATVDPDTEVARRHFDRGSELYGRQQYEAAIAEFKAANEARPRPAFDYNIARSYDRLGDWQRALDYYRRFLAGAGQLADEAEVRGRIAELEERTRKLAPPPPSMTPAMPALPRPHRLRLPAIVLGAAAVVAFAVGGALYGSAAADFPSRKAYCAGLPRECVPSEWADLATRADAGYALFAIGGALAAADVVLWILDARDARRARAALAPWFSPSGAGLAVGGSF